MNNATESIRRYAGLTPDAIAFESRFGDVVSYARFDATIDAVAHRLRDLAVMPGQTAVLATSDFTRTIVVALALARIGVAFAPASLPLQYADIVLADPGVDCGNFARVARLDSLWTGFSANDVVTPKIALHDDGANVLFMCPTSGSTGIPKFVPMSHELALRRVADRISGMAFIAGGRGIAAPRVACLLGPATSYGFFTMLNTIASGGTVIEPIPDVADTPAWLIRSRVNYLVTSPIGIQKVAEAHSDLRGSNALEGVEVGGGIIPPQILLLARQRICPTIIVSYGMTECGRVSGALASTLEGRPDAVGFPYPGVEVRILDDEGMPVAAGQVGLVSIRSPRTASSYMDSPEATAEVFRDGWVQTRDRGILDPDGMLRLGGRSDDIINRGGVKIDADRLAQAMMAMAELREVAVFGLTSELGVVNVCAAVVPTAPLDVRDFHARCRERLGGEAPDFILQLQALPRSENGKVLRHELMQMVLAASRGKGAPLPATNIQ